MFDGRIDAGDGTDGWGPSAGPFFGTSTATSRITLQQPISGVLKVRAATAEAYESTSGFTVNHSGGSSFYSLAALGIGNFAGQTTATIDSLTNITSIDITYNHSSGGGSGLYVNAWYLDDKVLVDASSGFPGGIFKKLYQTWTEQKAVVFYARIAAADLLMQALRDHAQPYSATDDYCEGTVISAFGQLWISVADAPATAFADKPALLAHPNWEQLNVSV